MSGAKERAQVIAELRERAAAIFGQHAELQSLLFSVAQYWNDQASDETHRHVIVSTRSVPVWPHVCEDYENEVWESNLGGFVPNPRKREGEACNSCRYDELRAPYIDVASWEPYCPEGAHQEMDVAEAYQPYALVRRDGDVELLGRLLRPHAELVAGEPTTDTRWDERARDLFAQVCAHPEDDGPRAILADHLLESRTNAVDPRGEYIALSLARTLDTDASARRDALLAAHQREWLRPLGAMIPEGCAWFERGFLARAHVYANSIPATTPTWGTVEVLRYLPGSRDFVDPAMTALRDVAICGDAALRQIAAAARPWRIERLQLAGDPLLLRGVTTLPRLRELVVQPTALAKLDKLPLLQQLDRLTVLDDTLTLHAARARLQALAPLRSFAVAASGVVGEPAGWRYTLAASGTVTVDVAGWHAETTLAACGQRLRTLPPTTPIELHDSPYRVFDELDVAELVERSDCHIAHL